MTRIQIRGGGWFNPDSARKWEESSTFDGRNQISDVTGSQWEHERLYRTAKGRWILHWFSQWQGSKDRYKPIDDAEAAFWLTTCGYEPPTPETAAAVEAAEI